MRNAGKAKLPRGLRQKKNGSYIVDITIEGKRKTKTLKTLDEALNALREMQKSPDEIKQEFTLGQAVDYCLKTQWQSYCGAIHYHTNAILKFFGKDKKINTITQMDISEFINSCRNAGLQDSSINVHLSKLATIFNRLLEDEIIDKKIKVKKIKLRSKEKNIISQEMEEVFLSKIKKEVHRDLVVLLLDTGLRVNEALNLRKEHIDLQEGFLYIYANKTDTPRAVPITSRVREILSKRIGNADLFPRVRYNAFYTMLKNAVKAAGLPEDITVHSLRHTCLSRLAKNGANASLIMAWAGHKKLSTSQQYIHMNPQDLKNFANKLDNAI